MIQSDAERKMQLGGEKADRRCFWYAVAFYGAQLAFAAYLGISHYLKY